MVWRIRDRATFVALREHGRRARQGSITVTFVPDPPDAPAQPPRVAYAVGRRVGNAVVRNRTRRRLRAAVQDASLPAGAYLIGAGPDASMLSFQQLEAQVAVAVRRATISRSSSSGRGADA